MSVTVIGLVVMFLSAVLPKLGLQIDNAQLTSTVSTIVTIVGALIVYWGRYRRGDITWYGVKIS